jgi:branched-chain amino acid transport system ATP-binding protein
MSDVLLRVENLRAYYGSAPALQGVSFSMGKESIAIVGRNGMGKSTLCAAIMGFTPPRASGSVQFNGKELLGQPSHKIARAGLGYVPQGRRLFPSLTVDEHLSIAARKGEGGWTARRVYSLFPRLAERKRNGGAELSGGEQQMLAIGRAMMSRPKLLMLDEPSMGLSPLMMQRIMSTITELKSEGVTILLVEQNAQAALSLADYGYVLEVGKIVLQNTGQELLVDENVRKAYLGED